MIINKKNIKNLELRYKVNLINSVVGGKSANLIGTKSNNGSENISIFSSIIHLGSNPPLVGFIIRPQDERLTDTYRNILETKRYTINSISKSMIKNSHYTSKKYEPNQSEFDICGIEKEYIDAFSAPFALDSRIKIGLTFIEEKEIINKCRLIVGTIELIKIDSNNIEIDGSVDFEKIDGVCITGASTYNEVKKIVDMPYIKKTPFKG